MVILTYWRKVCEIYGHNVIVYGCLTKLRLLKNPNERPPYSMPSKLYSWRFSRYSGPIHWLVYGHMTSNNETVSRQMPWAGSIAKTMMSNGKQFTVTRKMLTAVARHLSIKWLFVFHRFDPFVLLYNKFRLGKHWDSRETNSLFPSGPGIKC